MAKLKPLKEKEVPKEIDTKNNPFIVRTANEQMEFAASLEVPNMLFSEFIFESDLNLESICNNGIKLIQANKP